MIEYSYFIVTMRMAHSMAHSMAHGLCIIRINPACLTSFASSIKMANFLNIVLERLL